MEHPTKVVKVNASIDEQMVPLVELFNSNPQIRTISCCQGDPRKDGEIMRDAWIAFAFDNQYEYRGLTEFAFGVLEPELWKHDTQPLGASVTVTSEQGNYIARLHLPNAAIGKVTELLKPVFERSK
jgi:hypothetical protein